MDGSLGPGAIDASNVTTVPIVNRHLVALSMRSNTQKNPTVEGPIDLGFALELKVFELAEGCQEAPFAGWILNTDNRPIFHVPFSRNAVPRKGIVPLPPGQRLAVKEGLSPLRCKPLQANGTKPNGHGRSRMKLKRQNATVRGLGLLIVDEHHCGYAI